MRVLRFIAKVIAFPVLLIFIALQWVMIFLTGLSSVLFYILSGIVFLIAVASRIVANAPVDEVLKMLALSFGTFMIPVIGSGLTGMIIAVRYAIGGFIKS